MRGGFAGGGTGADTLSITGAGGLGAAFARPPLSREGAGEAEADSSMGGSGGASNSSTFRRLIARFPCSFKDSSVSLSEVTLSGPRSREGGGGGSLSVRWGASRSLPLLLGRGALAEGTGGTGGCGMDLSR